MVFQLPGEKTNFTFLIILRIRIQGFQGFRRFQFRGLLGTSSTRNSFGVNIDVVSKILYVWIFCDIIKTTGHRQHTWIIHILWACNSTNAISWLCFLLYRGVIDTIFYGAAVSSPYDSTYVSSVACITFPSDITIVQAVRYIGIDEVSYNSANLARSLHLTAVRTVYHPVIIKKAYNSTNTFFGCTYRCLVVAVHNVHSSLTCYTTNKWTTFDTTGYSQIFNITAWAVAKQPDIALFRQVQI